MKLYRSLLSKNNKNILSTHRIHFYLKHCSIQHQIQEKRYAFLFIETRFKHEFKEDIRSVQNLRCKRNFHDSISNFIFKSVCNSQLTGEVVPLHVGHGTQFTAFLEDIIVLYCVVNMEKSTIFKKVHVF